MTKYFRTALTAALLGFAALPAMAQPSPMVAQPDAQTTTAPDAQGTTMAPAKAKTHHHKHHHKTANTQKASKDIDASAPSSGDAKN